MVDFDLKNNILSNIKIQKWNSLSIYTINLRNIHEGKSFFNNIQENSKDGFIHIP
jgi:hypothetical protein